MQQAKRQIRERTCIGCGKKASKGGLMRIVRTSGGEVRFDATGRASGRGAYVCSPACFEAAWHSRLARALKTQVAEDDGRAILQELQAHADGLGCR